MNSSMILPPHVCGVITGELVISVPEVFWTDTLHSPVYAQLKWWGSDELYNFSPTDITRGGGKQVKSSLTFKIGTSLGLFEAYLRNCEGLVFRVVNASNGKELGVVRVKNVDGILSGTYASYFPIVRGSKKIGDLRVIFKLNKTTDQPLVEKKEHVGADGLSKIIAKGLELRKAMVESVLTDCEVSDIETVMKPTVAVSNTSVNLVDYLTGKQLTGPEQELALQTLRCTSPTPSVVEVATKAVESNGHIKIKTSEGKLTKDAQSQEKRLNEPKSGSTDSCPFPKVFVDKDDVPFYHVRLPNPPGIIFSLETLMPCPHSRKAHFVQPAAIISKKFSSSDVIFDGSIVNKIKKSADPWSSVKEFLTDVKVNIHWRHLNQRLPSLLGSGSFPDFDPSGLDHELNLNIFTKNGTEAGVLVCVIELGVTGTFGNKLKGEEKKKLKSPVKKPEEKVTPTTQPSRPTKPPELLDTGLIDAIDTLNEELLNKQSPQKSGESEETPPEEPVPVSQPPEVASDPEKTKLCQCCCCNGCHGDGIQRRPKSPKKSVNDCLELAPNSPPTKLTSKPIRETMNGRSPTLLHRYRIGVYSSDANVYYRESTLEFFLAYRFPVVNNRLRILEFSAVKSNIELNGDGHPNTHFLQLSDIPLSQAILTLPKPYMTFQVWARIYGCHNKAVQVARVRLPVERLVDWETAYDADRRRKFSSYDAPDKHFMCLHLEPVSSELPPGFQPGLINQLGLEIDYEKVIGNIIDEPPYMVDRPKRNDYRQVRQLLQNGISDESTDENQKRHTYEYSDLKRKNYVHRPLTQSNVARRQIEGTSNGENELSHSSNIGVPLNKKLTETNRRITTEQENFAWSHDSLELKRSFEGTSDRDFEPLPDEPTFLQRTRSPNPITDFPSCVNLVDITSSDDSCRPPISFPFEMKESSFTVPSQLQSSSESASIRMSNRSREERDIPNRVFSSRTVAIGLPRNLSDIQESTMGDGSNRGYENFCEVQSRRVTVDRGLDGMSKRSSSRDVHAGLTSPSPNHEMYPREDVPHSSLYDNEFNITNVEGFSPNDVFCRTDNDVLQSSPAHGFSCTDLSRPGQELPQEKTCDNQERRNTVGDGFSFGIDATNFEFVNSEISPARVPARVNPECPGTNSIAEPLKISIPPEAPANPLCRDSDRSSETKGTQTSLSPPDVPTIDVFLARVEVEMALNLPFISSGDDSEQKPSTYVEFKVWSDKGEDLIKSGIVHNDVNPVYDSSWKVQLPAHFLYMSDSEFEINVVGVESEMRSTAYIDLTTLSAGLSHIDGWFLLSSPELKSAGQIKVTVTPLEDITRYKDAWIREYLQRRNAVGCISSATSCEDVSSNLKEKMQQMEELTGRIKRKLETPELWETSPPYSPVDSTSKLNCDEFVKSSGCSSPWTVESEKPSKIPLRRRSRSSDTVRSSANSSPGLLCSRPDLPSGSPQRRYSLTSTGSEARGTVYLTKCLEELEALPKDSLEAASEAIERIIAELRKQKLDDLTA